MKGLSAFAIVIACLHIVSGQPAPVRPKLSESFSAEYTRSGLGTELRGSIYRNFEEGKQFQIEQLGAHDGLVNTLTRADLKAQYKYFQPYAYCSVVNSGDSVKVVRAWTWIDNATYRGQRQFQQQKVHVWAYNDTQNNVFSEMGVSAMNANDPVFIFGDSGTTGSFGVTVFQTFTNGAPPANKFDVPHICSEQKYI